MRAPEHTLSSQTGTFMRARTHGRSICVRARVCVAAHEWAHPDRARARVCPSALAHIRAHSPRQVGAVGPSEGERGGRSARQAAHERARARCRERVAPLAQAHPDNVVAVHCKAGKGRTGLVMICYLMYSGFRGSAVKARDFYDWARTTDGKGLTITSQANIM